MIKCTFSTVLPLPKISIRQKRTQPPIFKNKIKNEVGEGGVWVLDKQNKG